MNINTATFPPLESVTRPTLKTDEAAYYLNLKPQTMRVHACTGSGPVRPIRINGRLAWPTAAVKAAVGM